MSSYAVMRRGTALEMFPTQMEAESYIKKQKNKDELAIREMPIDILSLCPTCGEGAQ